ncbi:MAG: SGNH/GDSL hydrolase family protein [Pseudonocardiaceae bacterium]
MLKVRRMVVVAAAALTAAVVVVWPSQAAASVRLLVIGDSTSTQFGVPAGTGWAQQADELWDALAPTTVDVFGIDGATSSTFATSPELVLRAAGATHVIVAVGTNDFHTGKQPEVYTGNMVAIVQQVRAAAPLPQITLLHMPTPLVRYGPPVGPSWAEYGDAERTAALRGIAHYVDVAPQFPDSIEADVEDLVGPDGVHLTVAGHERLARAVVARVAVS